MSDIKYQGELYRVRTKHKRYKWTPERDRDLRSLYLGGYTYNKISKELGAPFQVVQRRLKVLDIMKNVPLFWTQERDAILRTRYLIDDNKALARKLDCAQIYVADRLTYLSLVRPYGWRAILW